MAADRQGAMSRLSDSYLAHLQELFSVLEQEHRALKQREFDSLDASSTKKSAMLAGLERFEAQRQQLLAASDAATRSDIEQVFNEEIRALLGKCQDLNRINGGIIDISRQFNQRMLHTILGASGEDHGLYDAAGYNTDRRPGQAFAKI